MKKTILLILICMALALCLIACNKNDASTDTSGETEKVTVTFDAGNEITYEVTVDKGSTVSAPEHTAPIGYDVGGWYLNGQAWDFEGAVNESITLVAQYVKKVTETLTFEQNGDYYVVTDCGNEETEIFIPEEYNGKPVKEIAPNAFKDNDRITVAVIGNNVEVIGNSAFDGCDNLKTVVIGSSVKTLGDKAFAFCKSIEEIALPEGIEYIGTKTFKDCSLLTKINLPDSLNYIGEEFLQGCDKVEYEEHGNSSYINNWLMKCNDNDIRELTIKEGTVGIYSYAFYYFDNLRSITIPSSVKYIGSHAFFFCYNVTKIELHSELEYIGMYAFYKCQKATSIVIPASVEFIGMKAFEGCTKLVINCEAQSEPSTFEKDWNAGKEVNYGYVATEE